MKVKYLVFAVLAFWARRAFSRTSAQSDSLLKLRVIDDLADVDLDEHPSQYQYATGMFNPKPAELSHSGHGG